MPPTLQDEAVDSLLNDPTLQLHDARSADPLVAQVQAWKDASPQVGDTWYALPARWYKTFTVDPGSVQAITTTSLAEPGQQRVRRGAAEGVDFELVPDVAWDALVRRFGLQGYALPCAVIAGVMPHHPPRIEVFPPKIALVLVGAPTQTPATLPTATLSIQATLAQLKSRARAALALGAADDALRFWRIPPMLESRAAAQGGVVVAEDIRTALPPAERVEGTDQATLGSLHLDAPSLALAVDVCADGVWRVADAVREEAVPSAAHGDGLRGLANLGNTCFMNSALQCLSNTPELQQYFYNAAHNEEMNTDNPLGTGGALAAAFGRLVQQLWGAQSGAVVPREFKSILGRFAPQFSGYAQHDSQELLAFLLDGLHEDLNRIQKKPYIEAPDWPGGSDADMVRFAQQQWDIYKARNDSIIVDLFQGQYRSTLVCPACEHVSIKFDPFMYLTLPIPTGRKWRGSVYVVPQTGATIQLDVQLSAAATMAQMRERIAQVLSMNAGALVLGEVWSHHVYRWLANEDTVDDIGEGDTIYAWEVAVPFTFPPPLTRSSSGRFGMFKSAVRAVEDIEKSFTPPQPASTVTLPVYTCLAPESASISSRFGSFRRSMGEGFGLPFFVTLTQAEARSVDAVQAAVAAHYIRFSLHPADTLQAFYDRVKTAPRSGEGSSSEPFSIRFGVPPSNESVQRGDDVSEHSTERLDDRLTRLENGPWPALYVGGALFCLWDPAVARMLLAPVPEDRTWGPVRVQQDPEYVRGTTETRTRPRTQLEDCLDEFTKAEQLGQDDLWYCPKCKEFRQAMKKFDLWRVPDILVIHLKRFKAGRMFQDKLSELVQFPVTGLDLSDRVVGTRLLKELPHDALPTSVTMTDKGAVAHDTHDDDVIADRPIYDLYGVDNHFGSLGGGHYTAMAKHPTSDTWHDYDDSSVRPVPSPQEMPTGSAYLLFYRRRTERPIGGKTRDTIARVAAHGPSVSAVRARDKRTAPGSSYLGNTPLPYDSE